MKRRYTRRFKTKIDHGKRYAVAEDPFVVRASCDPVEFDDYNAALKRALELSRDYPNVAFSVFDYDTARAVSWSLNGRYFVEMPLSQREIKRRRFALISGVGK